MAEIDEKIKEFHTHAVYSKKDVKKGLVIPKKMSPELAEILGIHFGDGHLSYGHNFTYGLSYTFDSRKPEYPKHVMRLFKEVFNITPRMSKLRGKNAFEIEVFSKTLADFFHLLGAPKGKKSDLRLPDFIRGSKTLLCPFLKGLFDTDGCFVTQRDVRPQRVYVYKQIRISTACTKFSREIKEALTSLGIRAYICNKNPGYDVTVRYKPSYRRFLQLMRPEKKEKVGPEGFEPPSAGSFYGSVIAPEGLIAPYLEPAILTGLYYGPEYPPEPVRRL